MSDAQRLDEQASSAADDIMRRTFRPEWSVTLSGQLVRERLRCAYLIGYRAGMGEMRTMLLERLRDVEPA